MKKYILGVFAIALIHCSANAQDAYTDMDYKVIAEGVDGPLKNFQVVCFNKYFNLERLPYNFTNKYGLTDKQLFKKMMLVELFFSDTNKEGFDKIELVRVQESETDIVIEYNIINSDESNDHTVQSPFIVAQIPKSKKTIRFVADGKELGTGRDLYINN